MKSKFKSFVFPETTKKQIDAMPAEMKLKFYIAVTDYGMYGIEPEDLSEIEMLIWIPMKDLLDNSKNSRGGAPEGNQNAQKQPKQPKTTENNQNNVVFNETTETTLNNANGNVNGNDKGNGNANLNTGDTSASAPSSLTAPQENYSKQVFELFKNAGLPCQNGDLFRFQCVDFKNSLQKLKGYSSAEVLQTIKNYIYELQHPDSWDLPQLSFSSFVGSRTWEKCTPANYRHENFLDFKKQKGRNTAPEIKERLEKCPACGKESLKLIENGLKYKCQNCGKIYTWEEINL